MDNAGAKRSPAHQLLTISVCDTFSKLTTDDDVDDDDDEDDDDKFDVFVSERSTTLSLRIGSFITWLRK